MMVTWALLWIVAGPMKSTSGTLTVPNTDGMIYHSKTECEAARSNRTMPNFVVWCQAKLPSGENIYLNY